MSLSLFTYNKNNTKYHFISLFVVTFILSYLKVKCFQLISNIYSNPVILCAYIYGVFLIVITIKILKFIVPVPLIGFYPVWFTKILV